MSLKNIKLNEAIDSLFTEYRKEVNAYSYAMFIDKKSEEKSSFRITIAPFFKKVVNFSETGSVNYFQTDDGKITVFLYSGLEDFVVNSDSSNREYVNTYYIKSAIDFSKSWSYIYDNTGLNDTITPYIIKGDNHPFINKKLNPSIIW